MLSGDRARRARASKRPRPSVEPLEARQLLSATLQAEGAVEVDVRASEVPAGTTSTISNLGAAGGAFNAVGGAITVGPVADANSTTYQALQFSGSNAASSSVGAPADLTGNSSRSIEVWVDNPTIDKGEETMVSWARRGGPNGTNEGFAYGSTYGVGQWGGAGYDLQWSDTAPGVTGTGAPPANTWHYLVFTYDGTNNSVYADGQLYLQQPVAAGGLQTIAGLPVNLAAQNTSGAGGLIADAGTQGSLDIASVRIENGALTADDVTNNFSAGVPGQTSTGAAPTTAPTLSTTSSLNNEVDLTWTYDPNANSYNVYRSDPAHPTPTAIATGVQSLSYADKTAVNGTTYTYYVTSVNDVGPGPQSNTVTATPTPLPPAAPTLSAPVAGNGRVQLSWTSTPLALSYSVYRSDPAHPTPAVIQSGITATSYVDKSVTNGVTYTYYVTAIGAGGSSPNSNTQTATPLFAALKAEGTVEVDVRASEVSAGTTSTINNLGTAGGTFNTVGGAITVGPVADANNTTYQALQFSGTNAASSSFNTPTDLINDSPRSIEVWVDNPAFDSGEETMVSWARRGGPNGTNEGFAYGSTYGVGQWGGAGYDLQWSDTAPGVTGTGAPAANTWHYLVFTYDGTNNSVYVDGQLYLQQPVAAGGLQTIAGLPVNLAAQNTSTSTGLIADAGTRGSLDIASVRIENGALTAADVTNNFTAGVPGQTSSGVAPTTAPTLNPAAAGNNEVDLTWTYDPNANSYNVYRSDPAHPTPVAIATSVEGLSYADKTAANGTTYTYYVTSVNDVGPGPASNTITATPVPIPPVTPSAPTVTAQGLSPVTATISFPAVPFASSYIIQRAPESSPGSGTPGTFATVPNGGAVTGAGSTITFTDPDPALHLGANYFYQVIAVNSAGSSAASPATELNLTNGVEDHYYNNQWWKTLQQNTSAFASSNTIPADDNPGGSFIPATLFAGGTGAAVPGDPVGPDTANFEPQVNKSGNANTAPFTGVSATGFSNVLTGKIIIPTAGQYSFLGQSDDDSYVYVDGTLVSDDPGGHGVNATPRTVNPIVLAPGTYDIEYFHSQGGGGWAYQLSWSALDLTSFNPIPEISGLVPQANLIALGTEPAAPAGLSASVGAINGDNISYPVTVTFTDNATNEVQYQLQRSTTQNFAPGTFSTVATTGVVDNGTPTTDATNTTTTAGAPTATITDPNAPAGGTLYYRLVAVNYDGSASATLASAVTTSPAATPPANGVEAHFYNNQWWSSTALATTAPAVSGTGNYYPAALTADVSATLPNIDADGTDTGGGPVTGIQGADFSSVFTGQVNIAAAGTYTMTSQTDDDGYLYVDDVLVSSDPGAHGVQVPKNIFPISLSAGPHDIEFFQSQGGGGWGFHLHESGPDTGNADQIVPSTSLTPVARPVQTPTGLSAAATAGAANATVTLTWTNNNTSAVRYVIQRSTDQNFASADVTTFDTGITGATFTDTIPLTGTYFYRVAAQNYDGTSAFTAPVSPTIVEPVLVSVGITDNPTAATVTTGNQRSQVRGLVFTFSSPIPTFNTSQLSLSLLNSGGSGANDNSAPTPIPASVFGTPTTPDGGTTWIVPFVASTANTSATGSLNDGIYTLNISGVSGVTSLTFHRLFGDTDGNKTVNALDYAKFKQAFGTSTGATTYNNDLDFDNNGTINALDYSQFKSRFGKTFSYT